MRPFETGVLIRGDATEVLDTLRRGGWLEPKPDFRLLACRLVTSESQYLHVEVCLLADPAVRGDLLLPHYCIALVITNTSDKTIGFVREAMNHTPEP